jgi:hypothetical protein
MYSACASHTSASAKYDTYAMKSHDNSNKIWNASASATTVVDTLVSLLATAYQRDATTL